MLFCNVIKGLSIIPAAIAAVVEVTYDIYKDRIKQKEREILISKMLETPEGRIELAKQMVEPVRTALFCRAIEK